MAWTTLTPDPPWWKPTWRRQPMSSLSLDETQAWFAAATAAGLAPYRLHYNGQITDSGGGGQLT